MKKITKRGWWIAGMCFLAAGFVSSVVENAKKGGSDSDSDSTPHILHVDPGTSHRIRPALSVNSLNGYHEFAGLTAQFVDSNGIATEWPVGGVDQRRLPADLTMDTIEFDAKLLARTISPALEVQVPDSLAGQSGTLELRGSIIDAPIVMDMAKREFSIQADSKPFQQSYQIQVSAPTEPETSTQGDTQEPKNLWIYERLQGLLILGFMGGILMVFQGALGGRFLFYCLVVMILPTVIYSVFFEKPSTKSSLSAPAETVSPETARKQSRHAKWLSPGARLTIKPKLGVTAVDGFHRITHISAWLKGVEGDQIELTAKPNGNRSWSDPIKVGYVRVGPVFKTNRMGVDGSLEVQLPDLDRVGGKEGTLLISGVVIYPDLGKLEILNPLDIEYELGEKAFTYEQAVRFPDEATAEGDEEPKRLPEKILFGISGLGSMVLLCGLLLALKRKVFG
ncbi:MAG: hypothetical protein P1V35_15605 [Planctomycetota bacterium]|nr:hypothetical protein [Planctomycetota bacterium]